MFRKETLKMDGRPFHILRYSKGVTREPEVIKTTATEIGEKLWLAICPLCTEYVSARPSLVIAPHTTKRGFRFYCLTCHKGGNCRARGGS